MVRWGRFESLNISDKFYFQPEPCVERVRGCPKPMDVLIHGKGASSFYLKKYLR